MGITTYVERTRYIDRTMRQLETEIQVCKENFDQHLKRVTPFVYLAIGSGVALRALTANDIAVPLLLSAAFALNAGVILLSLGKIYLLQQEAVQIARTARVYNAASHALDIVRVHDSSARGPKAKITWIAAYTATREQRILLEASSALNKINGKISDNDLLQQVMRLVNEDISITSNDDGMQQLDRRLEQLNQFPASRLFTQDLKIRQYFTQQEACIEIACIAAHAIRDLRTILINKKNKTDQR